MLPTSNLLVRATRLFQRGECSEADTICKDVIAAEPKAVEPRRLRSLIALQQRDFSSALRLLREAINIDPMVAELHDLLGTVHLELGERDDAVACYRHAIQLSPDRAQSHQNLGACLLEQGHVAEAITCLERAIEFDPSLAQAHYNLGNALQSSRRIDEAAKCYQTALEIEPDYGQAHANLGAVLFEQDELTLSLDHYAKALKLLPESAAIHNNLGAVKHQTGDVHEAINLYRRAIDLEPDYLDALANLSDAFVEVEMLEEAIQCLERFVELMPESAEAHNNLGVALQNDRRYSDAIVAFEDAIRLQPKYAAAYSNLGIAKWNVSDLTGAEAALTKALGLQNDLVAARIGLGNVYQDQHQFDLAMLEFNRAIELDPDNAEVRFTKGLLLLRRGEFEEGWQHYEWRWKTDLFKSRDLPTRRWNGESLDGQTILIHAEQGLGDSIQFVRYLSLVKATGAKVVFAGHERLEHLFRCVKDIDAFVALGNSMPSFDTHAPLLSLPVLFETRVADIPGTKPYLSASPDLVTEWKKRLADLKGLKIGICWQGNPDHRRDHLRSIPSSKMQSLHDVEGATLISLQLSGATSDDDVPRGVVDFSSVLDQSAGPFMDTAAIIENVDLVITCDTSIGHLAGALGRPVWVVLDYAADWRWMSERDDSPWYPSMRLFRQEKPGDWNGVMESIRTALMEMLSTNS